jgi:hypothetical protein
VADHNNRLLSATVEPDLGFRSREHEGTTLHHTGPERFDKQTALGATLDSDQAVTALAELDRIIGSDTA